VRDDNAIMEEASTCCLSLDDGMLVFWIMDVLYKVLTFGYIQTKSSGFDVPQSPPAYDR